MKYPQDKPARLICMMMCFSTRQKAKADISVITTQIKWESNIKNNFVKKSKSVLSPYGRCTYAKNIIIVMFSANIQVANSKTTLNQLRHTLGKILGRYY